MKKYYIIRTDFGNSYDLFYTDETFVCNDAEWLKDKRITRQEAIDLCKREVWRRKWDVNFSGYAPVYILPYHCSEQRFDHEYYDGTLYHHNEYGGVVKVYPFKVVNHIAEVVK